MINRLKNQFYRFLRWSERYVKTDMVYLTKGGFWLSAAQFISSLSSFILSIAFANLLPAEILGNYRYILSVVGILSVTNLGGLNTSVTQAVARGYDGSLKEALQTRIKWGTLGALIALIFSLYYYLQGNWPLATAMLIGAIFLPLMDPYGLYDSYLQGKKRFDLSSRYFSISSITSALVMIITLFLTKDLIFIMLAYFLPWTILRIGFWFWATRQFKLNDKVDPETISYGWHLSAMGVIGTIALYLDRLVVFHLFGAIELAVYSIAIAPAEQIKNSLKNLGTLALPKFSEKDPTTVQREIWQKTFKLVALIGLIVLVYILAAPFLFKLFFPKYLAAIAYSQVYALSIIATASILPYTLLQSTSNKKAMYRYNIWASIVQIVGILILGSLFGLWGVVWARVVTRFVNFGQLYFYSASK
ncbi:MAG: oligosaccharide flippase family protein [Candidatus Paceibacterota bacterium]|jgi:O-antigen/teichoic acid export membrane protein